MANLLSKALLACKFEHSDCFALSENGFCMCLTDNNFGEKDCPFYRNKDVVHREWGEMNERESQKKKRAAEQKALKAEKPEKMVKNKLHGSSYCEF